MTDCNGCSYKGLSTAIEDAFVGVRFGEETSLTLCSTGSRIYAAGDSVMVELDSGPAFGQVERSPMTVFKPCQKKNAKRITGRASERDRQLHQRKREREREAKAFAQEHARDLDLAMKISKVDFTLDSRKATVFFTAESRIDFRKLVRDLARHLSARVRMVQLGARDEAGLLGGIGICGRTLCCSTWLKDFRPISIQMAKRQNLSLNPSKISGQCGRLLCCLAYEDESYRTPKQPESGQN